jgi:hypothetical protein
LCQYCLKVVLVVGYIKAYLYSITLFRHKQALKRVLGLYYITYCYRPRDISGINNKTVKARL